MTLGCSSNPSGWATRTSQPAAAAVSRKLLGTALGSGLMCGAQARVTGRPLVAPKVSRAVIRSARPWQGCSRALSMLMVGTVPRLRKPVMTGSALSTSSLTPEAKVRTASMST